MTRRTPAQDRPLIRDGFSFALLALVTIGGCDVDFSYLLPAAVGQIELLSRIVPVERALESGELSEAQRAKLMLVQDVRRYAGETLGLVVNDSYTTFYNSHGEPVAFNISASRKDAFRPRLWRFPLVGTVPYLGYFEVERVRAKRDELRAQDLDVFVYEVDAYSGLGFYPNPILSPMLERGEVSIIDTVIHELLHNTIWRANDTAFNESLATFVGRTGALRYMAERNPEEPNRLAEAVAEFEDIDHYNNFALGLYQALDQFYASGLPSADKVAGREAVFQAATDRFMTETLPTMNHPDRYAWVADLPINNAWLLGVRRYNLELDAFARVLETTGGDWNAALGVFREAAEATGDPYDYLRNWANMPETLTGKAVSTTEAAAARARANAAPNPHRKCPQCRATTIIDTR